VLDFLDAAQLDRVGAFKFSREPGTPSHDMPDQVPLKVKNERYDRLMRRQQAISLSVNRGWVGKSLPMLVEEERDGWVVGRSFRDAPEIDGLVFARGSAPLGSIVEVQVEDAEPYDLYGAVEGNDTPAPRKMMPLRMAGPKAPQ
jgi:ribosomal protein S12 methylthiotransferase